MKVITIGSATLDVFIKSKAFKVLKSDKFLTGMGGCLTVGSKNEADEIFIHTGGGATNAAVTFANLGINCSVLSRVGADLFGREIERVLKEKKVGTELLQKDKKHNTSYSTLLLLGSGERSVLIYRGASNALEFPKKELKADWFYITSLGGKLNLLGEILSYAKKNKIKVMYNPGESELKQGLPKLKKYFKDLEVLNLNREEAALLCGAQYENMNVIIEKMGSLAPYVIITDGSAGAFLIHNGGLFFAPSLGTKPVNTTGAGDAFGSGFCAGMMLSAKGGKNDLELALRLAILNADGVIRITGAKNGILKKMPPEKEMKKIKIKREDV
ncbi:MAG: carbohydrate kinase family protein [Patescibacteria group bacterium]